MDAIEAAARSIAANKRGLRSDDPAIDRVWQSYAGQARAALNGCGLLQIALRYIDAAAEASGMFAGFGPRYAGQADVDARKIRIALGSDLPNIDVGDKVRDAWNPEDCKL